MLHRIMLQGREKDLGSLGSVVNKTGILVQIYKPMDIKTVAYRWIHNTTSISVMWNSLYITKTVQSTDKITLLIFEFQLFGEQYRLVHSICTSDRSPVFLSKNHVLVNCYGVSLE